MPALHTKEGYTKNHSKKFLITKYFINIDNIWW